MATATVNKSTVVSGAKRRYKLWMIFIVIFMGWAAYTLFGQMQQKNTTHTKYIETQAQLEAARAQSQDLQSQIDKLNDPEYISQLATKEQGMVKEGEKQIFSN
ncbi:septum formation initiator family protein [Paenibacillus sp. HB172176]|uniref:FtsB family cell division protein n=1 Tax=Paenibacillus sp. HB172176 TaxID=2493690 RepID=UPI00143BC8A6|nr:septum formation initiator family protein [Paenibacillus sp. HB172176]